MTPTIFLCLLSACLSQDLQPPHGERYDASLCQDLPQKSHQDENLFVRRVVYLIGLCRHMFDPNDEQSLGDWFILLVVQLSTYLRIFLRNNKMEANS